LVCAGDSLTAGLDGSSDEHTYVNWLRDRLGCKVVNAGSPGDKVADLIKRLDRDVLSHQPTAILLFIGGNDFLDKTPRRKFGQLLEKAVARLAQTDCKLVIVEVPTGFIVDPYAGLYRRAARKHGATLVPGSALRWWLLVELLARGHLDEPLTLDGLHLSPTGAVRVGSWLEPYIVNVLAHE
jgi:lysophospholipase L1-like esterase